MRIAWMVPLVALLSIPLAAQEPALDARLVYSGYGTPSFEINKPAYVALFEVTASGVMQLYPSRTSQLHQLMGEGRTFFSPQEMAFVERMNQGFMFDPFDQGAFTSNFAMYSMYSTSPRFSNSIYTFGRRGLFLVASTEPLGVGAPVTTQLRLNHALAAQGHHFDLNRESGLDALTALVTSATATAEIATDFVPILEGYGYYGSVADGFFGGSEMYLTNCGRFGAIPVLDAWRYGALCSAGVIVQAVPPPPVSPPVPGTPGTPATPTTPPVVGGGGCGPQYGSELVPCVNGNGGAVGPFPDGTRITDPERIRSLLAELSGRTPTPTLVGAALGGDGSTPQPRGRDATGRQGTATTVGESRTLDNPPAPTRGSGVARNWAPDASAAAGSVPRASAPRNEQPRAEAHGSRMPSPDRSPSPRTNSAPSPSPAFSAPTIQAAPASSPSAPASSARAASTKP